MSLQGVLVASLASALTYASAGAQTLTFSRDEYSSYAGARAIATADFDRNGWPDLAQANTGRNTVTILLNHRDTALTRAFDVAVGAGPFDLTTGDYNRDGIPDLVVANADGHSISILVGKGNGSFTRHDIAAPAANPRAITTADVNKDAKPDLIYSGYATRTVQVLIGDGAGGFTKGATYVGSPPNPQGIAAADFNHDGHVDMALAYASSGGLRILYSDRGTGFMGRTIAGDTYLNVLAVGDFNRDGWDDVAAASTSNSSVGIYLGSATGLVHTQTAPTGASPRGITAADVNDDGALDVMTANRASSTVSVLLGDRANPGRFLPQMEVGVGSGSRGVVASDFDADGRIDLATGNEYTASVTVLSNTTAFKRAAYVFHTIQMGTPSSSFGGDDSEVWPADFDRDGRLDVAVRGDTAWQIPILLARGTTVVLPMPAYLGAFAVTDLNVDGNPDVLYTTHGDANAIRSYLGDGRGGFNAGPTVAAPFDANVLAVDDFNRDGKPDLLLAGYERVTLYGYAIRVMPGRGDGTFSTGIQIPVPFFVRDVVASDVNGDGKLDAVTLLADDRLQIWWGDSAGGFSSVPMTMDLRATGQGVEAVRVADLNRDGQTDLVISFEREIGVFLGTGSGFGPPAFTATATVFGFAPGSLAVGDINVDGALDVITAEGDVLSGNGDGTFGPAERFAYGGDLVPHGLRLVDFNGDGLPDIVYGASQGEIGVLVNERNDVNRPPVVDAGPNRTFEYQDAFNWESCPTIWAPASDPDAHAVTYEWRDESGTLVSDWSSIEICRTDHGSYDYTLTVRDGRGGVASDTVTVTIAPTREIVVWAWDDWMPRGTWTRVDDPTAAGNVRLHDENLGAPKVLVPAASPASRATLSFAADPTQTYKLWIRLKADNDSWRNDSVWVQFSGAADVAGNPAYRIGTSSGLSVSLEECSGCGVSGWGWEDDGWGAYNKNGVLLRFPQGGLQTISFQTREDGVSIDQVVLSAEKYLTARPGKAKNDSTILMFTYSSGG